MEKPGFSTSSDFKVSCICYRDVLFFSADSRDPWQTVDIFTGHSMGESTIKWSKVGQYSGTACPPKG